MNLQDAYDKAFNLLKDKKAKGHTISIIEWMIAYNLLTNNVDIPYYSINDIDNMSQNDINKLAKLLTMNGNNRSNIKNILRYLHKLEEVTFLLPEVQDIILNNLTLLELRDIKINNINAYDVIDLLKNHRNKKIIREFIYDNLSIILSYNFLNDYDIISDNRKKLIERYDAEETNKSINYTFFNGDLSRIDLYRLNLEILSNFIIDLVKLNELRLVKEAIFLINEFEFNKGFTFNYYLTEKLMDKLDDKTIILIDIIGQDNFFKELERIIKHDFRLSYTSLSKILKEFVILNNFEFLLRGLQILIDQDYTGNKKIIYKILQSIKKSIREKQNDKIMKYIDIIGTMSFTNTVKSGNRTTNSRILDKFNKLIKDIDDQK